MKEDRNLQNQIWREDFDLFLSLMKKHAGGHEITLRAIDTLKEIIDKPSCTIADLDHQVSNLKHRGQLELAAKAEFILSKFNGR